MNFNTFTVKANYYRLAKVYHPDRVEDTNKAVAQEKFATLRLAYSILVDPEKKKAYDAGDTNTLFEQTSIAGKWNQYIQKIDSASVLSARTKYQGSIAEQNDVAREFEIGKGSMTHLLNTIPRRSTNHCNGERFYAERKCFEICHSKDSILNAKSRYAKSSYNIYYIH